MKLTKGKLKAITIIEALVALSIFSIVIVSFYVVLTNGMNYIIQSRDRVQAVALANQEMEKLRNLAYEDVALVGGIPSGLIVQEESISLGSREFSVEREVFYRDDADDGLFPDDLVPDDYKIVKITITWSEEDERKKTELVSRFVPSGLESEGDGGFLSVNVVDYSGNPVSDVDVNLYNDDVSPTIDLDVETNDSGNLLIQGAPASAESYQITLSKSGYEAVQTYDPHPSGPFAPVDEHATVVADTLNEKTLVMSEVCDIEIISSDPFGNAFNEVNYDLEGGRRLNTDEPPVYNYSDSVESDEDGSVELENVSGGTYSITLDPSESDYIFWKVFQHNNSYNQFDVTPGDSITVNMLVLDTEADALFIYVEDKKEKIPIEGASVTVTNTDLEYDVTLTTDKFGYAFFPEIEDDLLVNGETYEIEVTADGYGDETDDVTIDGLEEMSFILK